MLRAVVGLAVRGLLRVRGRLGLQLIDVAQLINKFNFAIGAGCSDGGRWWVY